MKIRILGTILWALGACIRRIDVLHLGWYMMGTGRKRTLPAWAWASVRLARNEGASWYVPEPTGEGKRTRMLFNAVGKFKAKGRVMLDRYVFYPICPSSNTHSLNCGCCEYEERAWQNITLYGIRWSDLRPRRIVKPIQNYFGHHQVNRMIRGFQFSVSRNAFTIATSDKTFADKGTPFYVTGMIPENVVMGT